MHQSVMDWGIATVAWHHLSHKSVVDIGSNSSNGTLRPLFHGSYVGVDLVDGPGVDRFPRDIELGIPEVAEVVVCTEVLEHVRRPWAALSHMRDCGRTLLLTCRGYDERGCWPVHEHPIDVWRFSALSLEVLAEDAGWQIRSLLPDPEGPGWLMVAQ